MATTYTQSAIPKDRSFLKEECDFHPLAKSYHADLYKAYQLWCITNEFICTISSKKFSQNLSARPGVYRRRGASGNTQWHGIKLKTDPDPEKPIEM